MLHQFIENWIHTWFTWVQSGGYPMIVLLMAMESSIIPVPSEIVMPPAAIMAAQGKLDLWLVILAGTFGSWLGSSLMYVVSRYVGRPIIMKWGKYFFIGPEKLERAERFLARYEAGGIFFARLLPVIRHLISIPAGIVRMPFGKFSLMTVIGSALWCGVLSFFGKNIAENNPKLMDNPDELITAIKAESHWIVIGVAVLCVLYFVMMRLTAKPSAAKVA